jgi:uncharacterized membrane protein
VELTGIYLTISSLVLLWALSGGCWKVLLKPSVRFSVLGGLLVLGLAWNVKASLPGMAAEALVGLSFQFFGASLLVAMYGLRPAIVMLAGVTTMVALISSWTLFDALKQFLLLGVLPGFAACLVMRLISHFLPKHLFIFILGHGYVAGVLSIIVPSVLLMFWHQSFSAASWGLSMDMVDWFVTLVILSFTEGSLSGMLLAVFVIYRPNWVPSFRDSDYLDAETGKAPKMP